VSDVFEGTVSGLQQRIEPSRTPPTTVWNFRLERHGLGDVPLPRIAIEMRGSRMSGTVANGDVVRITGRPGADGILYPRHIENLSSRSIVSAHGAGPNVLTGIVTVVVLLVILAVGLAVSWTVAFTFLAGHPPSYMH
jgi:hypothetical protein